MRILFAFFLFIFSLGVKGQLTVSNTAPNNSANALVNNVLMASTTGNVAQNVALTSGTSTQIGYFNGIASNIGINEGVLLSTRGIGEATPQGDGQDNVSFSSNDNDLRDILQDIANTNQIQKNTISLEFDFVAGGDYVEFEYVFASNEYEAFTCSKFNDVFGFFLSGPGISGPYSNNAKNIALVPNPTNPSTFTNTPVMINTVNSGSATGGSSTPAACASIDPNWSSYSTFFVPNSSINTVNFNGFTKVLKAQSNVQCGETYHIKLAIADVGDDQFNSAVFLKKGSFEVGSPLSIGIIGQIDFVKCVDNVVVDPQITGGFGDVDIEWTHNGNFFSNDEVVTLTQNGLYTITVSDVCGSISHTISVSDYTAMSLSIPDTIILCEPFEIIPDLEGGAPLFNYSWQGAGINSSSANLFLNPGVNGTVNLEIKDNCDFTISDEVFVFTPEDLTVDGIDFVYLCDKELNIVGEYFGGHGEVTYYWEWKGVKTYDFVLILNDATSGIASFHAIDECGKHRIHNVDVKSPGPILPIEIESEQYTFNICSRDVFLLPVQISGGAGNNLEYEWYIDDVLVSTLKKFQINGSLLSPGEHVVKVVLTDVCENSRTEFFKVNLLNCFVPNVITPSDDLVNDKFIFPIGDIQKQVELSVYDRWGIRIYYNNDYNRCSEESNENCWYGQYQNTGEPSIDGVYFYIITFSNTIVEKGTVNIFNE